MRKLLLAFLSIALFNACNSSRPLPSTKAAFIVPLEQRAELAQFLYEILVEDEAIFTLWGSQPLTLIRLSKDPEKALIDSLTHQGLSEAAIQTQRQEFQAWMTRHYNPALYQERLAKLSPFLSSRYVLLPKTLGSDSIFLFADLDKLTAILEKHYPLFKTVINHSFRPAQLAQEIKNPHSAFWNTALNDPFLLGLFLGYGVKNASSPEWHKYRDEQAHLPLLTIQFSNSFEEDESPSLTHLKIPDFFYFHPDGRRIKQYTKEAKKITKIYHDKDFLDITLQKMSEPSSTKNF